MTLRTETMPACNGVVIDNEQVAVALVLDVEVIPEREAVGAT